MSFESGPYLGLAVFCEQVIESRTGALTLVNVIDRLNVTASGPGAPEKMPPQRLPWTLVLGFKSGAARGTSEVKIVPEAPSGLKMPPALLPAHLEGGNRGANLVLQTPVPLEEPGIYWFWIYIDDELITKIPVEVVYARVTMGLGNPQP